MAELNGKARQGIQSMLSWGDGVSGKMGVTFAGISSIRGGTLLKGGSRGCVLVRLEWSEHLKLLVKRANTDTRNSARGQKKLA